MPKTLTPLYSCQTQWCRVIVFASSLAAIGGMDKDGDDVINCPVCEYEGTSI